MSVYTTATLLVNLSWAQTDTDNNNTGNQYTDAGVYSFNRAWVSGTGGTPSGSSACGQLWHQQTTLTPGGSKDYNMTGLLTNLFSGTFNTNFANVRAVYIENLASGTGANVTVVATGSQGFSGIFNGGSGNMLVAALSPLLLANYIQGFNTSATQNTFTIKDGGSGCPIRVAIIGI